MVLTFGASVTRPVPHDSLLSYAYFYFLFNNKDENGVITLPGKIHMFQNLDNKAESVVSVSHFVEL